MLLLKWGINLSVYYDILVGVKGIIDAVGGLPTSDIRYDVSTFEVDEFPLIIIARSPGGRKFVEGQFGGNQWFDYMVDIVLLDKSARKGKDGLEDWLDWEEDVDDCLTRVTLPSVTEVRDTNQGEYISRRIPATNIRLRGWNYAYRTNIQRTGN